MVVSIWGVRVRGVSRSGVRVRGVSKSGVRVRVSVEAVLGLG